MPNEQSGQGWLVMSLKWSMGSENIMWWGPNRTGYTDDIHQAGVYSKKEAFHLSSDRDIAVPIQVALDFSKSKVYVPAGAVVVDKLALQFREEDKLQNNKERP